MLKFDKIKIINWNFMNFVKYIVDNELFFLLEDLIDEVKVLIDFENEDKILYVQ